MSDDAPALTPTQDLAIEALLARARTGDGLWTFEARHRRTLEQLAELGLVTVMHGIVENTVRARLTDKGRGLYMDDDYQPPILARAAEAFGSYLRLVENIHRGYAEVRMDTEEDRELHARMVESADAALALVKKRLGRD